MQRRVIKGRPEVKDAFDDFGKLGHDRAILLFFFFVVKKITHRDVQRIEEREIYIYINVFIIRYVNIFAQQKLLLNE